MNKTANIKMFLIFCLAFILIISLPLSIVVGQGGPFSEIKEKMAGISESEHENLQNLFVLSQQITEIGKEEERVTQDIKTKKTEIEDLKVTIASEEMAYTKKMEDLKQVFKSYQRMGPGTYLEIILNSDNLAMLLRRVNTLRDLTRNTQKLMELLEESKAKQLIEKENLAQKIASLEDNQKLLQESLTKKKQLIQDQEKYLTSLKEKRESYQENLTNLQLNWDELKTSVPVIIKELSRIIDEGYIPPEKLNISFNFMSIRGTIDEKTLNDLISEYPLLPKIVLKFYPNNVQISIPEENLVLSGNFVIQEAQALKFQVKEGSFYGMPLDAGAIEDLFLKGDLVFKLKLPMSSNYSLNSIKTRDGSLELTITLDTEEAKVKDD